MAGDDAPARAALVTGGARGIGAAIAAVLAEEGHAVTLVDRLDAELAACADDLAARGHAVLHVVADLRDEAALVAAVAAHATRWGRLDVLVNNAGVSGPTPVDAVTARRMDLILDVNLRATVLCTREAIGLLRAAGQEHGRALVVNLASISARSGVGGLALYSAAKAGVVAYTQALNQELAADGIRATALCPASVDTPMTDAVKGRVPASAMLTVSDVAESVRFLLRTSRNCVVPDITFQLPGATAETFVPAP